MTNKVFIGSGFGIAPEHTAHRNNTEKAISEVFSRYGYNEISLPLYEYYDVLKSVTQNFKDESILSFVDRSNGKTLVLRPDFTPQVCRLVAGYSKNYPMPVRMCYKGTVFRNVDMMKGVKPEKYQMGCELYGAEEIDGDIELLMCMKASLEAVNIKDYKVIIGDAKFVSRVGELLGEYKDTYESILKRKQLNEHTKFLKNIKIPGLLKVLLKKLPLLFGGQETLREILVLSEFDPVLKERCEHMLSILSMLDNLGFDIKNVTIDPSETRGMGYYTGINFEILHTATGAVLGGGGRYDKLMEKFRMNCTACGMALNLTDIENVQQFKAVELEVDWIVVGLENLKKAEELREAGYKVVYLSGSNDLENFTSVVKSKNIFITI